MAAVDLQALAVARHIPLDSAPTQVVALETRPFVYALTPENGSVHRFRADRLTFARKLAVASKAMAMCVAPGEHAIYVLAKDPKALVRVSLDRFAVDWKLSFPRTPRFRNFARWKNGRRERRRIGAAR